MFLEYCNNGSLEELFQKRKVFSEAEVVILIKQIASAFQILHELKIIHRDLKPANILIHNKIFKIADFGFSRILENMDEELKIR